MNLSHFESWHMLRQFDLVAQIVNLLCRRLAVGESGIQTNAFNVFRAPQIHNLRYSRLPVCATQNRYCI
jgi:hypothetical protein